MTDSTHTLRPDGLQVAPDLEIAGPPWPIRGDGWIVFFKFDRSRRHGDYAATHGMRPYWRGGIGGLVWMKYRDTPVGPYDELMLVPGRIEVPKARGRGRGKYWSISRIWVSSWESVVSGRANWGIPKDRADFSIVAHDNGEDHLTASLDGQTICSMVCKAGLARIPINTGLFPVTLVQQWEGQAYYSKLTLKAGIEVLDVSQLWGDGVHVPDFQALGMTPLGAVKLDKFVITFPVPVIKEGVALEETP
ncbi:MAG: acetoacetate decarboxylase family protein [Pleurocapsa minor GSE-CHR-MK-17-07R]|jgi:hypothetical protein|nr:acetoacetate decarboxylase family protein [Pleurocapsa minor GSE-CHR-MK 17-07R]